MRSLWFFLGSLGPLIDPASQALPALCAFAQLFERMADLARPISISLVAEFNHEDVMPGMFTAGPAVDAR